ANPIFTSELTGNPLTFATDSALVSAGDIISVEFRAGTANALPSKIYFELQFSFLGMTEPTVAPTVTPVPPVDMITSSANDLNQIAGKVGTFFYKEKDVSSGALMDLTPNGDSSFWNGSAGLWLSNAPHKVTDVPSGKASIIQWEAASYGSIVISNYGSYGPHAQETQLDPPTRQTGNLYVYKNGDFANPIFTSELTGNPLTFATDSALVSAGDIISVEFRAGTANALPSKIYFELKYTFTPMTAPLVTPTTAPTAEPTATPTAGPTAEPTAIPTAAPTAEPTPVPEYSEMITSSSPNLNDIPGKSGTFFYKEKDVASGVLTDLTPNAEFTFWSGSADIWLSNAPHTVTQVSPTKSTVIQWQSEAAGQLAILKHGSYGPHAQGTQDSPPTNQTGWLSIYKNGDTASPIFSSALTGTPIDLNISAFAIAEGDIISFEFIGGTDGELMSKLYFNLALRFTTSDEPIPTATPTNVPVKPTAGVPPLPTGVVYTKSFETSFVGDWGPDAERASVWSYLYRTDDGIIDAEYNAGRNAYVMPGAGHTTSVPFIMINKFHPSLEEAGIGKANPIRCYTATEDGKLRISSLPTQGYTDPLIFTEMPNSDGIFFRIILVTAEGEQLILEQLFDENVYELELVPFDIPVKAGDKIYFEFDSNMTQSSDGIHADILVEQYLGTPDDGSSPSTGDSGMVFVLLMMAAGAAAFVAMSKKTASSHE
ncbi:MAG: PT domain-containing protein, partial [Saccharofermentanales bacterium]